MPVNVEDLARKVEGITRLIHLSFDETGGIELAQEVLPYKHPHYLYQLAREGKIPCRKINGRVRFSRLELNAWIAEGAPQPATKWADEYRARLVTPEIATDAA